MKALSHARLQARVTRLQTLTCDASQIYLVATSSPSPSPQHPHPPPPPVLRRHHQQTATMQRSARANYRPSVEVKYWAANASDQHETEEWLESELENDSMSFYASFLNWCIAQVQKLKDPRAKYPEEEEGRESARGAATAATGRAQVHRTHGYLRPRGLEGRVQDWGHRYAAQSE